MSDLEAELRAEAAQAGGDLVDRLDAVVQIERLAGAVVLALERLTDELLVVFADVGTDGTTPLGWRLDHRYVAQARKGHLQRAGNRCRRHRNHVDAQAQLAQQLLLANAEPLFLVEDQKAEILGAHIARKHAMSADQDVHPALAKTLDRVALLGRAAEA